MLAINNSIEFLSLPRNKLDFIQPILENITMIYANEKIMESYRQKEKDRETII